MEDYLIRVITTNKEIRGLAVRSTEVVREAQKAHQTSPVATAALGRALTGALLMGSLIKSGEEVGLRIVGDGPLKQIIAEANMYGDARGYVANPGVESKLNQEGKLDVASAIGNGQLFVHKKMGLKEPYEGSIPLVTGEIGDDLTYYFTQSEQTPSAVGLGVLIDPDLKVKAAGGFLIQLLPDASEETIDKLERNLKNINSVSRLIEKGLKPEDILKKILKGFDFRILARRDVRFKCKCSKARTRQLLDTLDKDELNEILEKEGLVEIKCHFCGKVYRFNENEINEGLE